MDQELDSTGGADEAEDTEGHKKNFRVEDAGGEDTEGHKKHVRIEDAGGDDTEGHVQKRR
jgi:hypothetical protein